MSPCNIFNAAARNAPGAVTACMAQQLPAWGALRDNVRAQLQPLVRNSGMTINLGLEPILAILAGIAILIMPRLLNYIVAIYLIVIGVLGLT